ncbi:glycoside hydrolase family 31 protein [bacterium]|nr:glycoside hydrolase family 31 protein [bacterium]
MNDKPTTAIEFEIAGHAAALDIGTDRLVRLRIAAEKSLQPDVSYAVACDTWMDVDAERDDEGDVAVFKTASLVIRLQRDPFSLRIEDHQGNLRFSTAEDAIEHTDEGLVLRYRLGQAERVYGLGETGENFDKAGVRYSFSNTDDPSHNPRQNYYTEIPFSIHLRPDGTPPHAVFMDNPSRGHYDLGWSDPSVAAYRAGKGDMVVWLLFEDTIRELLSAWSDLTGRMERPPIWALGNQQCRWSYFPEARVREIASEFRSRRIPCDVLYLDIDYMDGFRVFTWDPERFPDPKKMLDDLREDGFRVVAIVDPGVKIDKEYHIYKDFIERDEFFVEDPETGKPFIGEVWPGDVHFPDFTNPEVRKRWGEFQEKHLLEPGISGIWNDMNEPSNWKDGAKTLANDVIQHDFGLHRTHEHIHQIYGMTMARTSAEGFQTARPNDRPFVITRSGWAGVQRYSMVWTGDNHSTWASMPFDLRSNLGMSLTGVPFVGCDIGGFVHDCYGELYARWIEWGVFQPFCRTHTATGTADQEPWSFGPDVERIARRMIELRMQLLPYLYTAFVEASETGAPINRPLVFEHQNDATTHRIADQFLVGADLLVAPILEHGKERRAVYLPAGEWIHYWSNKRHEGGRWIVEDAPLGAPPVYVRAGAVIPMHPVRQNTAEAGLDLMFLDVFPANQLHGGLVEDDGLTQAWRNGEEARLGFGGWENDQELKLLISAPEGDFQSPRRSWAIRLHRSDRPVQSVTCNGKDVAFEREGGIVQWTVSEKRTALEIVVKYGA